MVSLRSVMATGPTDGRMLPDDDTKCIGQQVRFHQDQEEGVQRDQSSLLGSVWSRVRESSNSVFNHGIPDIWERFVVLYFCVPPLDGSHTAEAAACVRGHGFALLPCARRARGP